MARSFGNKALKDVLRLLGLAGVVAAFGLSLTGVVYMSLQGKEVKVPELVGKNFTDCDKELASMGLKIKRRAERVSAEPIDSVIEQLPKPGETVKTGQVIYIVTSKGGGTPADVPPTVTTDEDDSKKIEEMISDKPKKKTSTKKKADTTRDITDTSTDTDTGDKADDAKPKDKKDPGDDKPASNKSTAPSSPKKDADDSRPKKDKDAKPKPAAKKDR